MRSHLKLYPYFPLMMNLDGKRVLIIGGGLVASRRADTLLRCGALVDAVSPEFNKSFPVESESGRVRRFHREFESSDVNENFALIFAATNNRNVNHRVFTLAKSLHVPVNVCDDKRECDFFFPSLINCGSVAASVSSGGLSVSLTRRLSDKLRKIWSSWVSEESKDTLND